MPEKLPPRPAAVPQFALYGEPARAENGEFVHIELIETRSRQHGWHIAPHTHRGLFQVLFLLRGQVRASIDDAHWDCTGPCAVTIHPAVVHGFDFSQEAEGFVLTIDQQVLFGSGEQEVFASLFLQPLAVDLAKVPPTRERIEALLQQLLSEATWSHFGHFLMLEWLARSVLLLLVRVHAENRLAHHSGHGDFELFTRFRAEVEARFCEQWMVGQYAAALRVTPARLNRLCFKLAGKSAYDISQDRLMLEACRKLTYAPSGIASIAYELGFQDPAYFSRLFKKRLGVTPRQFRQQETGPQALQ